MLSWTLAIVTYNIYSPRTLVSKKLGGAGEFKLRLFSTQLLFIRVFNKIGGLNPLLLNMKMLLAILEFYFHRKLLVQCNQILFMCAYIKQVFKEV